MRILLVALAMSILAALGWGQPTPKRVATLDAQVMRARRMIVGRVKGIAPRKDSGGYQLAPFVTFSVEETLKGEPSPTITIVGYRPDAEFERMRKSQSRVLVFLGDDGPEGNDETGFVELVREGLVVVTADYKFLRTADEALEYARAAARRTDRSKVPAVLVPAPSREFEEEYAGMVHDDFPIAGLVVPADDRLERRARRETESKSADVRLRGLKILRLFKTPENVAIVKRFLADPTVAREEDPLYNWGIEVSGYPLRGEALGILGGWGVEVPKRPVVRETFDHSATQTSLIVSDPQSIVREDKLATLPRFRRLEKLKVMVYRVSDAHLALIAKAKSVVTLDVNDWSNITDAGLAELVAMPRLRTLYVGYSKVTDAGLPTLAKIKSLRWVNLAGTSVTPEGIAAFRRLRPDVEVSLGPV